MIKLLTIGAVASETPPNPSPQTLPDVISGVEAWWDAKTFPSMSTVWVNSVTTPPSGVDPSHYDNSLGVDQDSTTADPGFDENHFTFDGGAYFNSKTFSPSTVANMHKTDGTDTSWSWFGRIKTPSGSGRINTFLSTAGAVGSVGITIRTDSGGRLKVDQYDGEGLITQQYGSSLLANTSYNICVAYNAITDTLSLAVNNSTFTAFHPSGWTLGLDTDATYTYNLCANGATSQKFQSGAQLSGQVLINKAINNTELAALNTWANLQYGGTPTPLAGVVSNLVSWWDAVTGYSSGQFWENQIASPADGEDQTAYNVYLGSSFSPGTNDPTYNPSGYWDFDGGDYFASLKPNPPIPNLMHKTIPGTKWTWWGKINTAPSTGVVNTLFGTADINTDYGIIIRVDAASKLNVDFYNGVTSHSIAWPTALLADTVYDIVIAYDYSANQVSIAVNDPLYIISSTSTLTPGVSANPTYNYKLCCRGNFNFPIASGCFLYGQALIDHALNNAELERILSWSVGYYYPLVPVAPSAPIRMIINPGDEEASLAWVLSSDGGAGITDNVIQYKLHSDMSWTTFSHDPESYPGITVDSLTNASNYDFRVAATNVIGTSPYSSTVSATPRVVTASPYSLSNYYYTEPVDSLGNRSGIAQNIFNPALATYESAWFSKIQDSYVFKCPDGGATTSLTADYARSEFRDLTNHPLLSSSDDTVYFAVASIPNGLKTIVHQIHGFATDNSPWIKMSYTGKDNGTGILRALIQPTRSSSSLFAVLVKSNITNGDKTLCKIAYDGGTKNLTVYIDGVLKYTQLMDRNDSYYYKRGNYFANRSFKGNICTVVHYPPP